MSFLRQYMESVSLVVCAFGSTLLAGSSILVFAASRGSGFADILSAIYLVLLALFLLLLGRELA